jgi:hypothetical protein
MPYTVSNTSNSSATAGDKSSTYLSLTTRVWLAYGISMNEESDRKGAEKLIAAKLETLLSERNRLVNERGKVIADLHRVDRAIADCRAAARVLGLDLPADRSAWEATQSMFSGSETDPEPLKRAAREAIESGLKGFEDPVYGALSDMLPKPSVRDFIIAQLKQASAEGAKAGQLRDMYESSFGKAVHDKTVGMALYRLQKDGVVRRRGHVWFIAKPTAVETEGSKINS